MGQLYDLTKQDFYVVFGQKQEKRKFGICIGV